MAHEKIFINYYVCNSTKNASIVNQGGGASDCSNEHLVTNFYSGSSVMSLNRLSLLSPSIPTGSGDNTS
jgi:hypothetical protein